MKKNLFTFLIQIFFTLNAYSATNKSYCENLLSFANNLHQKNQQLSTSEAVEHEQNRLERMGFKKSSQPSERIADWLNALEQTHSSGIDNKSVKEKLLEYYFAENIIQAGDVPESYFKNQQRIAREQGHGNIEITSAMKQQLTNAVIADQKSSLKIWVEYLLSKDAERFPFWTKYWVFTSILKMGAFDIESGQYLRRSKGQVAPFPELNSEALGITIDGLIQKSGKKTAEDYNFSKQYGMIVNQARLQNIELSQNVEGEWKKYKQGSDPTELVDSLSGKNTGWCTASIATARSQLQGGDFHVYYSLDNQGKPTIPRIAIRFEGEKIAEVRGRDKNQNLDSKIASTDIVIDKLNTFGEKGKRYEKASSHMKILTGIEKKIELKKELSEEELSFLYEIDEKIEGFGYGTDPRILEILNTRNTRKDLAIALKVDPLQISFTQEEALSGNIAYHYGPLFITESKSAKGIVFPKRIGGDLSLPLLKSAKGAILPERVGGNLLLDRLTTVEGLVLPQRIDGDLIFHALDSAEGLVVPEHIAGVLIFKKLRKAKGIVFPQHFQGSLCFKLLNSAEGLVFSESIGGSLLLDRLEKAEGMVLPKQIGGGLYLNGLKKLKGLVLPQHIGREVFLDLATAEGLVFPQSVGSGFIFTDLTSAKELVIPASFEGSIFFKSRMKSKIFQELVIPQDFKGKIIFQEKNRIIDVDPGFIARLKVADEVVPPKKHSLLTKIRLNIKNLYKGSNKFYMGEGNNYILMYKQESFKETLLEKQMLGTTSFTPEERAKKRVYVKDQKLVSISGEPLQGENRFVMLDDGSIYASSNPDHSFTNLALDQDVAALGKMFIADGEVLKINHEDNDYNSPPWLNQQFLDRLNELGVTVRLKRFNLDLN